MRKLKKGFAVALAMAMTVSMVACTIMTQIIAAVASSQYGGQSVDIRHLGKYLRKSYNKYKALYQEEFGDRLDADTLEELVKERS